MILRDLWKDSRYECCCCCCLMCCFECVYYSNSTSAVWLVCSTLYLMTLADVRFTRVFFGARYALGNFYFHYFFISFTCD